MTMFKKYLLSFVAFEAENEKGAEKPPVKTAAELREEARNSIKVTTSADEEKEEVEAKEPEEKEEKEVEAKEAETEEAEAEIETAEAEVEDLKAEKADAKTPQEKDRVQRRIDRAVAKQAAAERRVKELEAELAAAKGDGTKFTVEDVQKEAKRIAAKDRLQEQFDEACERLGTAAVKADKDFDKKVKLMSDDIGPIPTAMIGILDDLDNGGSVLSYLTNNIDETENIYKLSPARMAVSLAKLSNKLIAEAKPKPKAVSKVPAPNEPINSNNRGNNVVLHDKMSDADWIEQRQRDVAQKRASGRRNLY